MKTTGLYFGSFNPVHIGHLIVAESMVNLLGLDELRIVVSPHNPHKLPTDLAPEKDRIEMIRLAINNNEKLVVSDVEFTLPRPSFTVNTLRHLQRLEPDNKFVIVLGEDAMKNFHQWKDFEWILENFALRFFPRHGVDLSESPIDWSRFDAVVVDAPRIEVSSTRIRENFRSGISNKYVVTEAVLGYISHKKLYGFS